MGGKKRPSAALSAGLMNRSSATGKTPENVVENVRKQLEALEAEIKGLRDSIETANREIEQVQENKNNAEEEKEQAEKGVASANDAIEEAKDEIKQAKDEIKQVKDDLTKAKRSRERLQNLILDKEKIISDDKKIILSKEKVISDNNKIIRDNNKIILSKEKIILSKEKKISDDKQALLAKEEKRDELEKLITLDSVWDALAIQLPLSSHVGNFNSTKSTKYGKTSTIKHKYHPSGVWELPTDQLRKVLRSYRNHAMDDKVPRVNLRVPVTVLFPKSMAELSGEGSVSKNCERVFEIVLDVFNDSENLSSSMLVKPPGDLANHDPGQISGWVGQPDQSISFKTPKGEYRGILCVEIKTPLYQTRENESLAVNWCNNADCNDACGSENHPSPPEKDAEKQHETWKSPIRQIYSYMCANQKRVAVVSTYEQWWFVVRDCTQQVFVSRAFKPDSQYSRDKPRGESLLQMLFLWIQFAMDTDDKQSDRLKNIERWEECPVGSSSSSSSSFSSTSLGSRCQHSVIQQTYIPPCVKGGPTGFERRVVSVGCFEKVKTLGAWKTGATWITDFDGQRGVVKCADCLKNPEAEEHVVQETKIYEHLKSLQGGAIPRLLYGDYTLEDFLYAVCTSYAGKSLGEFKGRITQELAKNVRECIKKVNDAGVWHNDIAARNFVVDENLGVKLIDFGESRVEPSASVDESRAVERMLAELSTPSN